MDELELTLVVGKMLREALGDSELEALVVTVSAGDADVLAVAAEDGVALEVVAVEAEAVSEAEAVLDELELTLVVGKMLTEA